MRTVTRGVADRLDQVLRQVLGVGMPVGIRAWDGSTTGPERGPQVVLRHRRALRHLLWSPGELGLARAYVSGDIEVHGDLADGLRCCWEWVREHDLGGDTFGARSAGHILGAALRLGVIGPRPRVPDSEMRPRGRLHSRRRDRSVIEHHYDLGNEFYELLLGSSRMAYSCAYWARGERNVDRAQEAKLDMICRKLGVGAGTRLLDIGCGWGSLLVHAARRHGARVTGITLSARQHEYATDWVRREGLRHQVEVRLQDYRELDDAPYDAVASIEMGEHVGEDNYPGYAETLYRQVRQGGPVLVQQMSRGVDAPGGGPFIESYIAPDMSMVPLGHTLNHLERAGFEIRDVRAMREHYGRTIRAWEAILSEREPEARRVLGAERLRVWRLYLAGAALAFAEGRMGVNQILATHPRRPDSAVWSGPAGRVAW